MSHRSRRSSSSSSSRASNGGSNDSHPDNQGQANAAGGVGAEVGRSRNEHDRRRRGAAAAAAVQEEENSNERRPAEGAAAGNVARGNGERDNVNHDVSSRNGPNGNRALRGGAENDRRNRHPNDHHHHNNNNNNNHNNRQNNQNDRRNNNNNNESGRSTGTDLHDAILANSHSVVKHYLQEGVDPNRSPVLQHVSVIVQSQQERARDLHRTIGRVFRSRTNGRGHIHPLHVAVCNAYHHCHEKTQTKDALGIVQSLLEAGANPKATCSDVAFCKIGIHPSVTLTAPRTASKVALFLKRFPLTNHETECCAMLDKVAQLILEAEVKQERDGRKASALRKLDETTIGKTTVAAYEKMVDNPTELFSDICFECPDGKVYAHKCVLAASVPYFAVAFGGQWKEATAEGTWKTTNKADILQAVVRYIYTGKTDADLLENETEALLRVANEYQMESFQMVCQTKFVEKIATGTVKHLLLLSKLLDLAFLQKSCFEFIRDNMSTVLTDPDFVTLASEEPELWKEMSAAVHCNSRKRRREDETESEDGRGGQ